MSDLSNIQQIQLNTIEPLPMTGHPVNGVRELYDPDTHHLKQRATYVDNQLHGPLLMYNAKGYVDRKFEFRRGVLSGVSEFYRDNNLYANLMFIDGILEGIATYYDPSGNRLLDIPFEHGEIEGDMIFYGSLGHVARIIPYEKGRKQGIAKSYYPGGALAKTEPFQSNLLEGNVTQYYEDGNVCSWCLYEKGKLMEGPRIFNKKSQEVVLKK